MVSKKLVGYSINSKMRCIKVYVKLNKKGKKVRVLHNGKKLKKGKRVFKTKKECEKRILKLKQKKEVKAKPKLKPKRKKVKHHHKLHKFGDSHSQCYYEVPYFGGFVPSVPKYSGGDDYTGRYSGNWMWPAPPGARAYDTQQGSWNKYKLA